LESRLEVDAERVGGVAYHAWGIVELDEREFSTNAGGDVAALPGFIEAVPEGFGNSVTVADGFAFAAWHVTSNDVPGRWCGLVEDDLFVDDL
jgi:hypothetical protein